MNIKEKKEGGKLTVFIEGNIDTTTAPTLSEFLQKEIPTIDELLLDFEKVNYISSAGLRVLLSAQKIMNQQGGMKLKNVNETIMEIFEVTGFSEILTVE